MPKYKFFVELIGLAAAPKMAMDVPGRARPHSSAQLRKTVGNLRPPGSQHCRATQKSAAPLDPACQCILITKARAHKSPLGQRAYLVENFVDNPRQRRR